MASARESGLGRSFWTLVTSSGLSNLADGVFKMALPLVAIQYTRSPAVVAGLELARSLPWLLAALQVGALTDLLDRRRLMLGANVARIVFVALPAAAIACRVALNQSIVQCASIHHLHGGWMHAHRNGARAWAAKWEGHWKFEVGQGGPTLRGQGRSRLRGSAHQGPGFRRGDVQPHPLRTLPSLTV